MHYTENAQTSVSDVRTFVLDERKHCVSDREWAFRLRGYGYGIKQTETGTVVTTLPQGVEICTIEA